MALRAVSTSEAIAMSPYQRSLLRGQRGQTWHDPGDGEHVHQAAVVSFARLRFPSVLFYGVPNAGAGPLRGMAGKMRAEGALAGVPDLVIARARGRFHGGYVEMKSPRRGAKPSPDQIERLTALDREGYWTAVCWGADAGRCAFSWYLAEDATDQMALIGGGDYLLARELKQWNVTTRRGAAWTEFLPAQGLR